MDLSDKLQSLVNSSGFAPLAFVFAFLAGAAHAVGPGHGKTLAAAYLVGNKGRLRDAVWLSGSVALMHTISVLVIAIGWTFYSLSDLVELTTLTTVLQLVAGLLTLAAGGWLLHRHLSGRAVQGLHSHGGIVHSHGGIVHSHSDGIVHSHGGAAHSHDLPHSHEHAPADEYAHVHDHEHSTASAQPHPHDHQTHLHDHGHTHDHDHDHDHGYAHDHHHPHDGDHTHSSQEHSPGRPAAKTARRPGVVVLGAAGGLVPSPTAFLVLTTGFFSGHAAFALLLVITFGIGMATVLFGVGLLALGGSSLITRGARSTTVLRWATRIAPTVAAVAITTVGVIITTISVADLTS